MRSLSHTHPKDENAAISLVTDQMAHGKSNQAIAQRLSGEYGYDEEKTIHIMRQAAERLVAAYSLDNKHLMAQQIARADYLCEVAFSSKNTAFMAQAMKVMDSALSLPARLAITGRNYARTHKF